MNKNIILSLVGIVIIVISGYFLISYGVDNEKNDDIEISEINIDDLGPFSQFFRTDLTEGDKITLKDIMERVDSSKKKAQKGFRWSPLNK